MLPPLALLALTLQALIVPAAAAVDVKNKPQILVTISFTNFDGRWMDHWGGGGGATWTILNDSAHPFVNRHFGGAKRKEIMGTRAFGSGYPWDKDDPTTLSGRGFPFGVWPLWWGQDFMGTNEYNSTKDTIRPGGQLVTAAVQVNDTNPFTHSTKGETYYVIGDVQSVTYIMISFVTWCHTKPAWPTKFDPLATNATIRLENVLQYYRASSFALASTLYNNTFARTSIANSTESSPLPAQLEQSDYRQCVDGVIAKALPVMNKPPPKENKALLYGLIFGFLGLPMLVCAGYLIFFIVYLVVGIFSSVKDARTNSLTRRAREKEDRQVGLAYEAFP